MMNRDVAEIFQQHEKIQVWKASGDTLIGKIVEVADVGFHMLLELDPQRNASFVFYEFVESIDYVTKREEDY